MKPNTKEKVISSKDYKSEVEKILMRLNIYHLEEPDYMINHKQATKMLLALIEKAVEEALYGQKLTVPRQGDIVVDKEGSISLGKGAWEFKGTWQRMRKSNSKLTKTKNDHQT